MDRFRFEWTVKLHHREAARATIGHAIAAHQFQHSPQLSTSFCFVEIVGREKSWKAKTFLTKFVSQPFLGNRLVLSSPVLIIAHLMTVLRRELDGEPIGQFTHPAPRSEAMTFLLTICAQKT
jgi:hypothetical protein